MAHSHTIYLIDTIFEGQYKTVSETDHSTGAEPPFHCDNSMNENEFQ